MLIDEFQYHFHIYRQHQRLTIAGIKPSQSVLTQLCAKVVSLLKPVAEAQCQYVLKSKVLAIDDNVRKSGCRYCISNMGYS